MSWLWSKKAKKADAEWKKWAKEHIDTLEFAVVQQKQRLESLEDHLLKLCQQFEAMLKLLPKPKRKK